MSDANVQVAVLRYPFCHGVDLRGPSWRQPQSSSCRSSQAPNRCRRCRRRCRWCCRCRVIVTRRRRVRLSESDALKRREINTSPAKKGLIPISNSNAAWTSHLLLRSEGDDMAECSASASSLRMLSSMSFSRHLSTYLPQPRQRLQMDSGVKCRRPAHSTTISSAVTALISEMFEYRSQRPVPASKKYDPLTCDSSHRWSTTHHLCMWNAVFVLWSKE